MSGGPQHPAPQYPQYGEPGIPGQPVAPGAPSAAAIANTRILGVTALVFGIVALVLGAFTSVLPVTFPLLASQLHTAVTTLILMLNIADALLALVAVIAVVLGIAGVVRPPRSLLAAWAIGVGGCVLVTLGVGMIITTVISGAIR
jgi:hypothetical protein